MPTTVTLRRLTWLVLAAGVGVRLWYFLHRGAFWVDEAYLGLNLLPRSLGELFLPMAYDQYAPPLFLVIAGLVAKVAGTSALALRTPALLAGIATIGLCAWVAWRLLPPAGALFATAVVSFCPALVRYSSDFKPYEFTALATALVLALTLWLLDRVDDCRRWVALGIGGLVAIGIANSAPFVLAAAGAAVLLHPDARKRPELGRLGLGFGVAWAVAFAMVYIVFYQPAARDPYMNEYFGHSFLTPDTLGHVTNLRRLLGAVIVEEYEGSASTAWRGAPLLFAVAGLTGAIAIVRRLGWAVGALILGPFLAGAFASMLHKWPIVPRTMVYTVPLAGILLGSAADALQALRPKALAAATALLLAFGTVGPALAGVLGGSLPVPDDGDISRLREELNARNGGEPLYVFAGQTPPWIFHSTDWSAPDTARLSWAVRIFEGHHRGHSRGAAVKPGEGWDESRSYEGRRELMGISTGMLWLHDGYATSEPDSGWAANEAGRIEAEGSAHAWLLLLPYEEPGQQRLIRELERRGAQRVDSVGAGRSRAMRFALCATSCPLAAASLTGRTNS